MDAIKKQRASLSLNTNPDAPQSNGAGAIWWTNWAKDHCDQIVAYNKNIAENGVWSDGLRTF